MNHKLHAVIQPLTTQTAADGDVQRIPMTNHEFGAYLIACGKLMIENNIDYPKLSSAFYLKPLAKIMMREGIDGRRADALVNGQAWYAGRNIKQ